MVRRLAVLVVVLSSSVLLADQVDPAAAIQKARQFVGAKQYAAAVDELKPALPAAQALPEAERGQAVAAVHFYTAVALAGLNSDTEAKAHLLEFLAVMPNTRVDPAKYDAHFVSLFNEVKNRDKGDPQFRFETYYPGLESFEGPDRTAEDSSGWGTSPALAILGSRREKQEWNDAVTPSMRAAFIESFWNRRDPNPETPRNEFRDRFDFRVAFADKVFDAPDGRGSTSDRGKVFILLGPPASVRRRPLARGEVQVYDTETVVNGTLEQWVYSAEQLPIKIPKDRVTLRFVTQRGIGDGVLQREDIFAFKAMTVAMNPNETK